MNWKKWIGALLVSGMIAPAVFAEQEAKSAVLSAGTYTAKVKTLVCGGCGPIVQKILAEAPVVEFASVDQENRTATFTVKKGARLEFALLQKSLDAAAQQMGMGADYTLFDLHKADGRKAVSSGATSSTASKGENRMCVSCPGGH